MTRGILTLILGLALIVIALVGMVAVVAISANRMWPDSDDERRARFRSNGERIYYTATSESGQIPFTGGPRWLAVHGGGCVNCHGPDGRGGTVVPMTSEVAPDIRLPTLTSEEHGGDHAPYTEETIRRAITQGIDPEGERLSYVMPRWRMSGEDLDDLISYLRTLDGGTDEP